MLTPSPDQQQWPRRISALFTRPKLPAWAFILLGIIQWVPDWKARIEFWFDAARSMGGYMGTIATVVASPYFNVGLSAFGVAWLIFIGEPVRGVQRDPRWRYVGWSIFAICLTTVIVTAGYGAIEIYIREEIATRQATILHDGTNPHAPPQPADATFLYRRRLSSDQFRTLVQEGPKLKPFFPSLLVTIAPGDGEADTLRLDLVDALIRGGITISEASQVPEGPDQTGVMIAIPDIHNPPEDAEHLRQALEIIGIIPKYITLPADRWVVKAAPILFIGPRPI
jgi:hypothetical protein